MSETRSKFSAVKKRHAARLRSLPNVIGLGVGPKVTDGITSNVLVVKVYVTRKVPEEQLEKSDRIPSELDGVKTDVEVQAPLRAR